MAMGVTQELCFSTLAIHLCSAHCSCPSVDFISFWRPFALSILHYPNIWFQRFFFFFASSSLFFLDTNSCTTFAFKQQFFCLIFGMRQTVMQRWDTWVEVQGKHCGLCAQSPFASGTLEALFVASGFGEKLLKSHCSTEQSVTLWIIVCSYTF